MKKFAKALLVGAALLGSVFTASHVALAQAEETTVISTVNCTINGRTVPCEEAEAAVKNFIGNSLIAILVIVVISIISFIFWIMMLVHAVRHDIKDKTMWVILMVFTGVIGSLIYYFVVKRNMKDNLLPPQAPMSPPAV